MWKRRAGPIVRELEERGGGNLTTQYKAGGLEKKQKTNDLEKDISRGLSETGQKGKTVTDSPKRARENDLSRGPETLSKVGRMRGKDSEQGKLRNMGPT